MNATDSITLIVAIVLAGLGLVVGFARTLRFFTHGIFGVILSVFVCATFGGMIQGIGPVQEWFTKLNDAMPGFLQTIHAATIIYYILLFLIVQILRVLIVRLLAGAFSAPAAPVRVINRILGMVLMVAAVLLLVLLVFAVIAIFGDKAGVIDFVSKLDGTFLGTLYEHNPVQFV